MIQGEAFTLGDPVADIPARQGGRERWSELLSQVPNEGWLPVLLASPKDAKSLYAAIRSFYRAKAFECSQRGEVIYIRRRMTQ